MNYRQWKKAYKKRYGRNPSTMEDRSKKNKLLAKGATIAVKAIPEFIKLIINGIADVFNEAGKCFISIAANMREENGDGADS